MCEVRIRYTFQSHNRNLPDRFNSLPTSGRTSQLRIFTRDSAYNSHSLFIGVGGSLIQSIHVYQETLQAASSGQAQGQGPRKPRQPQEKRQESRQRPSRYQPYPVVSTNSQDWDGCLSLLDNILAASLNEHIALYRAGIL